MKTSRLWLIDAVRILSIVPIITLHLYEILFSTNQTLGSHIGFFNSVFEIFVRSLSFSGFTIVFIFFFLSGYKTKAPSPKKILIVVLGAFTLSTLIGLIWYEKFVLEWDIYYFLILAFIIILLVGKHLAGSKLEVFFLFVLSVFPYEKFWPVLNPSLKAVLYGNCSTHESMWPILPSIFFVLYSFTLGKFCIKDNFSKHPLLGGVTLFASLCGTVFISYSYFYNISPGPDFGCYSHKLPYFYWAILILSLSLMFISSTTDSINKYASRKIPVFISSLSWNRNFGLCYLFQWLLLILLAPFESFVYDNPSYFFALPILIFITTEVAITQGGKLWR